eukprot:624022_1
MALMTDNIIGKNGKLALNTNDREESNDALKLNDMETDKIFDNIKVSSSLSRRLTDKRKNEILVQSGCHSIYHIIDFQSFNLSNQMDQDIINYLSNAYFNFPTHLPMIVCYGDEQSNAIAKQQISKICKDIQLKKELRKYRKQQAETKRKVEEYKAQFVEDGKKQRGYHELGGSVFYSLPFRPINIRHGAFAKQYHCQIRRYSHINQIKNNAHLKFLQFRYDNDIKRHLPIFLIHTKVKKQHNAIMKEAIKFIKTFKYKVEPKKGKTTDDTTNDLGYREVNGWVFHALPITRLQCQKLTGHRTKRIGLKNIVEQYDCNIWMYFDMTKIRMQNHLRFLKLEFGDDIAIAKNLPICLIHAPKTKAKNMKPA